MFFLLFFVRFCVGFSFESQVLADQQQVILKGVLEEPIDNNDNKATIKAKMFYKSCMELREYH